MYERKEIAALKHVAILGSTGSIGQSTLSIVESYPERFAVASLAAGHNIDAAFQQCLRWRPKVVSLATEESAADLEQRLRREGRHPLIERVELPVRVARLGDAVGVEQQLVVRLERVGLLRA